MLRNYKAIASKAAMLTVALVMVILAGVLPKGLASNSNEAGTITFGLFKYSMDLTSEGEAVYRALEYPVIDGSVPTREWLESEKYGFKCKNAASLVLMMQNSFIAGCCAVGLNLLLTLTYVRFNLGCARSVIQGIVETLGFVSTAMLIAGPIILHSAKMSCKGREIDFTGLDIGQMVYFGGVALLLLIAAAIVGCVSKDSPAPGGASPHHLEQMQPMKSEDPGSYASPVIAHHV